MGSLIRSYCQLDRYVTPTESIKCHVTGSRPKNDGVRPLRIGSWKMASQGSCKILLYMVI